MNIFTAVLSSLKGLVDFKAKFLADEVKEAAVKLILGALGRKSKFRHGINFFSCSQSLSDGLGTVFANAPIIKLHMKSKELGRSFAPLSSPDIT